MNFFEKIPTSWLLAGAVLGCLVLWAAPSSAQTSGNAVAGRALFDATQSASGQAFTHDCANCHAPGVQNRRTAIGGSAFADISFDEAMTAFGRALNNNSGGMSQFTRLGAQHIHDIAAYIADTPKLTAQGLDDDNTLALVAPAVGSAVTANITVRHSIATTDNLDVTSVGLGAGPTAFTVLGNCVRVLAPADSCSFSVRFQPTTAAAENKALTVMLRQGSVDFTRSVSLEGSVMGATSTPSVNTGSGDSGGGALGGLWLSGLALATAVLARGRRT